MQNQIKVKLTPTGWLFFNPLLKTWLPCTRLEAHKFVKNVLHYDDLNRNQTKVLTISL